MKADQCVLVTGATGFVGGHLLSRLAGNPVRVAVRTRGQNARLGRDSIYVGDVNERTDWAEALAGVRCVVHMAAHVHVMKAGANDRRSFHEVNTLGTERLALAAAAAAVKRFIFISSIKVNGESTTDQPFSATDVPHPIDEYGTSKWEAEQRLFQVAWKFNMEAVIVRPTLVYGPGVGGNFLKLLTWIHKGVPLPLASIMNARSMLNVWNLCDLLARMVDAPMISPGVYLASDGVDLSTPELIQRIAAAMGRPARLFPVPESVLRVAGALTGTGLQVRRLCDSLTVDMTSTRRLLDWTPPTSIDEGLMRTVRWYLDRASGSDQSMNGLR